MEKSKNKKPGWWLKVWIDFKETFIHTIKWAIIRIVITLASWNNWRIKHLDVWSTLLNGKFKQEISMVQLKGFKEQGKKHQVCKLKKVIYGLW